MLFRQTFKYRLVKTVLQRLHHRAMRLWLSQAHLVGWPFCCSPPLLEGKLSQITWLTTPSTCNLLCAYVQSSNIGDWSIAHLLNFKFWYKNSMDNYGFIFRRGIKISQLGPCQEFAKYFTSQRKLSIYWLFLDGSWDIFCIDTSKLVQMP